MSALRASALLIVAIALACAACKPGAPVQQASTEREATRPPPPPPPPDEGDIGVFHACKAEPRRTLSALDQCQIDALRARCTPADDCLVSCITSPQGHQTGGGCEHACFFGLHQAEPKPSGWNECLKRFPTVSGSGTPAASSARK
jgi:hypothetical protein